MFQAAAPEEKKSAPIPAPVLIPNLSQKLPDRIQKLRFVGLLKCSPELKLSHFQFISSQSSLNILGLLLGEGSYILPVKLSL